MALQEYKDFLASKTVWGALVALTGSVVEFGHYNLSPDDAAHAVDLITSIVGALGSLYAIYGRVVASKKIAVGSGSTNAGAFLVGIGIGMVFYLLVLATGAFSQEVATSCATSQCTTVRMPRPRPTVVPGEGKAEAPTPRPSPVKASQMSRQAAQDNPVSILQGLQQFAMMDIQAALADAQAQTPPDAIAATCYQELISLLGGPIAATVPNIVGIFSTFQKARDIANVASTLNSNSGPMAQLNIACAPLVVSTQTTLIRLGVIGGLVAGGLPPIGMEFDTRDGLLAYQQNRDRMIAASGE